MFGQVLATVVDAKVSIVSERSGKGTGATENVNRAAYCHKWNTRASHLAVHGVGAGCQVLFPAHAGVVGDEGLGGHL